MQQELRGGTIKITKCYIFCGGGGGVFVFVFFLGGCVVGEKRLKMKQDAMNNSKRSPELVSIGL